jgi:hypothetical protein
MATSKELHEQRCARTLAKALTAPGLDFSVGARTLRITAAPGLEIGSVVWEGAAVLVRFLSAQPYAPLQGARVLELGCGVGACGLASRALGARTVLLTDCKAAALALAAHNVEQNRGVVGEGVATALLPWGAAAWGEAAASFNPPHTLLIGSDLVYTEEGSSLLCETIDLALRAGAGGMLLSYKERGQGGHFFSRLAEAGLSFEVVFESGEHSVFSITKR